MRRLILRRSVSSWVSPGPRVPMPAAQLAHRLALAGEPRQLILELRQLHLQLAFASPRMACKDVQDQLRPVDDAGRTAGLPGCASARVSGRDRTAPGRHRRLRPLLRSRRSYRSRSASPHPGARGAARWWPQPRRPRSAPALRTPPATPRGRASRNCCLVLGQPLPRPAAQPTASPCAQPRSACGVHRQTPGR